MFLSSVPEVNKAPSLDEMQSVAKAGMDHLIHLRLEGRLPGMTTNQHGTASIKGRLTVFPHLLSARFETGGAMVVNHYNILQVDKDSPWQLERAWQTDSDGRIIKEWRVKDDTKPAGHQKS
jgi:hypothetical protein